MTQKKNSVKTSSAVAKTAGKKLRDKRSSKTTKKIAASALCNRKKTT